MKYSNVYIVFLIAIFLPLVGSIVQQDQKVSTGEKRSLVQWPTMPNSWDNWKQWPDKIDRYINDQTIGRSIGQKIYNTIYYKMGANRHRLFVLGKDGWIFNNNENNFAQYKGLINYKPKQIKLLTNNLTAVQSYCEQTFNASFLMFVAPDKHFVYPEFLPAYMDDYKGAYQNLSKCEAALKKRKINYLEMPNYLKSCKEPNKILYDKAGAHWSTYGAFKAYQRLIIALKNDYPNIPLLKEQDLKTRQEKVKHDFHYSINGLTDDTNFEWTKTWRIDPPKREVFMMNDEEIIPMDSTKLKLPHLPELNVAIIETENSDAPVLLLIRDSFGNELIPFLEHSFSKIILVHHFFGKWDPEVLADYKADIVVYEVAQRNLGRFKK